MFVTYPSRGERINGINILTGPHPWHVCYLSISGRKKQQPKYSQRSTFLIHAVLSATRPSTGKRRSDVNHFHTITIRIYSSVTIHHPLETEVAKFTHSHTSCTFTYVDAPVLPTLLVFPVPSSHLPASSQTSGNFQVLQHRLAWESRMTTRSSLVFYHHSWCKNHDAI